MEKSWGLVLGLRGREERGGCGVEGVGKRGARMGGCGVGKRGERTEGMGEGGQRNNYVPNNPTWSNSPNNPNIPNKPNDPANTNNSDNPGGPITSQPS